MTGWQEETLQRYFAQGGDQRFRLDHYDIPSGVILEVGAGDGSFTWKLAERFPNASIVALEPIPDLCAQADERLRDHHNVAVLCCGLWSSETTMMMRNAGPASVIDPDGDVSVRLRGEEFLRGFGPIKLLIMNIEGAEYEVLPHILRSGLVTRIRDLQIQFHDVVPDAVSQRRSIQQQLSVTHRNTYDFPFVMENWRRQ